MYIRERGLPVGTKEWLTLMDALDQGLARESQTSFYFVARSICCRSEQDFDLFDQAFLEYFENMTFPEEIKDEFFDWLKTHREKSPIPQDIRDKLNELDLDSLRELFEKRLEEQKEQHNGGNRWIGTGGTSPFGHSGYHPSGIRVGGSSLNRKAMQIAAKRSFKNLRKDIILDTRQFGLALKKLHHWSRDQSRLELDLDGTIDRTAANAGDIELVFKGERKNNIKLLLLMDVGGSMTYHSQVCESLFTATHKAIHFKEMKFYYFHNCPYETLYSDIEMGQAEPTEKIMKELDSSWFVMIVGDAAMSPYELTEVGGAIDYYHHNPIPGIEWLRRIKDHFPKSIWLNPEPTQMWRIPSTMLIRKVFTEMFPMTLNGLDEAISTLKKSH